MEVTVSLDCLDSQGPSANEAVAIKIENPDPNDLSQRLQPGQLYTSLQEFESVLEQYQKEKHVLFIKDSATRLKFEPSLMERLVYQLVMYTCKQGKKRRTESKGIRPNQSSWKVNCNAFIRLGLKEVKKGEYYLQVKSSNLVHKNHPVNEENALRYPENRRVAVDETMKTLVVSSAAKNSEILEYISSINPVQTKTLTNHDLANLKRKICREAGIDPPTKKMRLKAAGKPTSVLKVLSNEQRVGMLQPLLLKGWSLCAEKDAIQKQYLFSNFNEAFRFITGIGLESNRIGHYPEWHNKDNSVAVILTTDSVSGITIKDIKLANFIESLAV